MSHDTSKLLTLSSMLETVALSELSKTANKKASVAGVSEDLLNKYAQEALSATPKVDPTDQINQVLAPYGYAVLPGSDVKAMPNSQYVDVRVQAGAKAKWKGTGIQAAELKKLIDPITTATLGLAAKPVVYS